MSTGRAKAVLRPYLVAELPCFLAHTLHLEAAVGQHTRRHAADFLRCHEPMEKGPGEGRERAHLGEGVDARHSAGIEELVGHCATLVRRAPPRVPEPPLPRFCVTSTTESLPRMATVV